MLHCYKWWVMHTRFYIRVRSYHFILIDIQVDEGKVIVMDSLRKDISEYRSVKDMFDR